MSNGGFTMTMLTFYTVECEQPGYPVKYCKPANPNDVLSYGRVQTFVVEGLTFSDPGEACGEFEAWSGSGKACCYLEPAAFRAKVKALHKMRQETEKKLAAWKAMVTP
jgi:hypothetical protein